MIFARLVDEMWTKSLDKKYVFGERGHCCVNSFMICFMGFTPTKASWPIRLTDNESFRQNWATKIQREKMYGPSLNHIGTVHTRARQASDGPLTRTMGRG